MTVALLEQPAPTQAALPFAQAVHRAPEQLVLDYRARFGTVVSPTLACELSPEYTATSLARITLTAATLTPATELSALVWQNIMDELKADEAKQGTVLIVAGPSGSSKMTLARHLDPEVKGRADAILFTSLADALWVYKRVEEALAATEQVVIAFIHRGIELSAKTTLQEAVDSGRCISLDDLVTEYAEAEKGIVWLNEKYRHSTRVHIGVIDATGQANEIRRSSVAAVNRAQQPKDILLQRAKEAFSDEYRNQSWKDRAIHDAIFKTTTGQEPPSRTYRITTPGHAELHTKSAALNPRTLTLDRPTAGDPAEPEREVDSPADERRPSNSGYSRSSLYSRSR